MPMEGLMKPLLSKNGECQFYFRPLNYNPHFFNYKSFFFQLTTPLSYKSSISPTCSSVKKDNRPISDKRWQQDQFTKVKNFFCVRNMPEIANNLRPPTLNNFVAAVNILLKTLDPKFDIRMDNYKDAIPKYLKELGYPANIPQSLMKCGKQLTIDQILQCHKNWCR